MQGPEIIQGAVGRDAGYLVFFETAWASSKNLSFDIKKPAGRQVKASVVYSAWQAVQNLKNVNKIGQETELAGAWHFFNFETVLFWYRNAKMNK